MLQNFVNSKKSSTFAGFFVEGASAEKKSVLPLFRVKSTRVKPLAIELGVTITVNQ